MSDDLISRKALIESLSVDYYEHYSKNHSSSENDLFNLIVELIENYPNSYDVNKVIKQLEELIMVEYEKPENCDENEFGDGEEIYEDGRTQGKYEAYKKALEIVKSGGASND